jgi:hypothetical protein
MPRIKAPAHSPGHASHANVGPHHGGSSVSHVKNHTTGTHRPATNASVSAPRGTAGTVHAGSSNGTATGGVHHNKSLAATGSSTGSTATSSSPAGLYGTGYTYGSGARARNYRAYGYGSGYRNRYYGRRYGYGRSQGYNRAIVGRLRSVLGQLARIDHDYRGHRVRAMHAISMAIRQLSHRSMIYNGVGFAPGMNRGLGMGRGMRMGPRGAGLGAGRMSQAQSDARMSHALRTLQGVNMQLVGQAGYTMGQARARGHVMRAIHELSVALSIR